MLPRENLTGIDMNIAQQRSGERDRTFAIIENGSWAPTSGDLMQKFIDEELKNMTVLNERLSIASSMLPDKAKELETLAQAIVDSVNGVDE